jgi:predicted metal-dependent hydrolase
MRSKVSRSEFTSLSGQTLPLVLRRGKGTRHMRLSVNVRNEVVVSLPWHCSDKACQNFIEQNRKWLERQINAAPRVIGIAEWLRQSPWLSAGGERLEVGLKRAVGSRARYRIEREAARIELHLPAGVGEAAVYELVRKFAREVLVVRVAELAKELGLNFNGLSVRDQSSRWGSCSSKGTVSLNWRLVLLPPHLQDYIIYHELAHLTEMNHSKKFWRLLETYDPQRVAHERELDRLTPRLLRVRGT